MPAGMKQKLKIRTDLQDKEKNLTGETIRWGDVRRDVYRERIPQSKLVRIMDPDTKRPMMKRGPTGNPLSNSFHTERVPITDINDTELIKRNGQLAQGMRYVEENGQVYLEREYILVDQGNGIVRKNYYFRPDPEFEKREAAKDRKARLLDSLLERFERGELSAEEALDGVEDETAYPEHIGFGAWRLSDGTELPRGTKKDDAIAAEEALSD